MSVRGGRTPGGSTRACGPIRGGDGRPTGFGWTAAHACDHHGDILEPVVEALAARGAKRVLDLGSGNGSFTHQLRQRGFDVVGVEPDRAGVELARQWGGDFRQMSVYDSPDSLGSFDAVVCTEVIEHLFDPGAVPRFARAVLPVGGLLVVTTPYHGYLKNLMIALRGGWDAHLEPLHDGGHIKFFSPRTLGRLLVDQGFTDVSFRGAGRVPWLWRSMVVTAVRRG
jgi:2-polyprenyl-3-methyl-5-hydroxy-6-metoxy-1,4-benzoquinol methylase